METAYKEAGLAPTRVAQLMAAVDGADKYAGKDLEDVPIPRRRDAAVKECALLVKKWFDMPCHRSDLAAIDLLVAGIPSGEGSLPWGPRVTRAGMVAQRVIAGGGWDITDKDADLSRGSLDCIDFLKKFFGSAESCYGEIMPPKEELRVLRAI